MRCQFPSPSSIRSPDKLESAYLKSLLVAQMFIYGCSLKASLVAVVIPDAETLVPWAQEKGIEVRARLPTRIFMFSS